MCTLASSSGSGSRGCGCTARGGGLALRKVVHNFGMRPAENVYIRTSICYRFRITVLCKSEVHTVYMVVRIRSYGMHT